MVRRTLGVCDLPVVVSVEGGDGENLMQVYLLEKREVTNPDTLRAFVKRWRNLWLLSFDPTGHLSQTTPAEDGLISGAYNAELALECLEIMTHDKCVHLETESDCPAAHLVLPLVILDTFSLAKNCGVPFDMALHRLCGVYAFEQPELQKRHC